MSISLQLHYNKHLRRGEKDHGASRDQAPGLTRTHGLEVRRPVRKFTNQTRAIVRSQLARGEQQFSGR